MNPFILFRILGNDLPPRHADSQTLDNTKFMLQHEPELRDCERVFLLNRIYNPAKRDALADLLDDAGVTFFEIPFEPEVYKQIDSKPGRLHYLTNVNAARNRCLEIGFDELSAEMVLPMDGGCAMRRDGWESLLTNFWMHDQDGYFLLPTWRCETYEQFLDPSCPPQIREAYQFPGGQEVIGIREPMVAFTQNHDARFDPELVYGKCDKCELLFRLGVPGIWDRWEPAIKKRALTEKPISKFYTHVKMVSYNVRLPSGKGTLDHHNLKRGQARKEGMMKAVDLADEIVGLKK